ncbi:MAG: adenylate/guanylate cyclase domain-containing protein [SAR324 cluster bacterium]|nr:adenylate/guanylate cyclase domain-containing protein [SAR324 cluster bacterium]
MINFLKKIIGSQFLSPLKIAILVVIIFSGFFLWVKALSNIQTRDIITSIDRKIVDYSLRYRGVQPISNQVALITVDAKSIKQLGRWPWSRKVMQEAVNTLNDHYQVGVIGFDIVFSEADQHFIALKNSLSEISSDELSPETVENLLSERDHDRHLAEEISSWDNIVCGYFFRNDLLEAGLDEDRASMLKKYIDPMKINVVVARGDDANYSHVHTSEFPEINIFRPMIGDTYKSGFFSITPDPDDGVVRRVESVYRLKDDYYPSLPIKMYQTYLSQQNKDGYYEISIDFDEGGMEGMRIGDLFYPTASDGTLLINFRGPQKTIKHFSFVDVLNKEYSKEELKGKLVIIGVTELGVFDIRSTPVASTYPGLEVQGTVLDNILQNNFLQENDETNMMSMGMILLVGLLVGLIKKYWKNLAGDGLIVLMIVGIFFINYYLINMKNISLSTAYPALCALLSWFLILLYTIFSEGKDKRFITSAFSQYLAPKVIDQLIKNPSQLKLGGTRKRLTIMFTDLQGFSAISEVVDVYQLTSVLNKYLTMMVTIIMKHGGTVDKFEGDAIIAFWGAPVDSAVHAQQACQAAIEMQGAMVQFREDLAKDDFPAFIMRVGINTGEVMVGNFGSKQRMDYTVIGDAANLAARLEGINKVYGTYTMISENTKNELDDNFEMRQLDEVQVVGKQESIKIYELQELKGVLSREAIRFNQNYKHAYRFYRNKNWKQARKEFVKLNKIRPADKTTKVFIDRIDYLLANSEVAKSWNGVYRLTSK